ncbi:uncharacterized protein TNCV_1621791 [Trichonephila clavipes]|nr:uncharacterized protein TNCV_1621791 [Trichonephila clavipes]
MGHEDELTKEELQEILNEEHQETQRNVSPSEQEEDERGPMPTSAIKDLLKKWTDEALMWFLRFVTSPLFGNPYPNNFPFSGSSLDGQDLPQIPGDDEAKHLQQQVRTRHDSFGEKGSRLSIDSFSLELGRFGRFIRNGWISWG